MTVRVDPDRRSLAFGEVRTRAGKPWVGAKVVLYSNPLARFPRVGTPDCVEATTDTRGRFRAPVLLGRSYTVWARGPERPNGAYRHTVVAEKVVAQVPIILRESREALRAKLRVTNLEAWDGFDLEIDVVEMLGNQRAWRVQLDAEGECDLPPLATRSLQVLVLGRKKAGGDNPADAGINVPIHQHHLALRSRKKKQVVTVQLPKQRTVAFAVRDGNSGKGLGGATIWQQFNGRLLRVGSTEKDGFVKLKLTSSSRLRRPFFVRKKGYAMGHMVAGKARNKVYKPLRKRERVHYHANVPTGTPGRGKVLIEAGKPAADLTIMVRGYSVYNHRPNSYGTTNYEFAVRTNKRGEFHLPNLSQQYGRVSLTLIMKQEHIRQLPKPWRPGLREVVTCAVSTSDFGDEKKWHEIVLTERCPVDLIIRTPHGLPGDRATLSMISLKQQNWHMPSHYAIIADRNGRVRVLLDDDGRTALVLNTRKGPHSEEASDLRVLRSRADSGDRRVIKRAWRMDLPLTIGGKVVGKDGEPVAGMNVYCYPYFTGLHRIAPGNKDDADLPATGNAAEWDSINSTEFNQLFHRVFRRTNRKTDKKGRFSLPVPRIAMQYRLYGNMTVKRVRRQIQSIVEVEGKSITDLEIEVQ